MYRVFTTPPPPSSSPLRFKPFITTFRSAPMSETGWDSLRSAHLLSRRTPPPLDLHVQLVSAEFCAELSRCVLDALEFPHEGRLGGLSVDAPSSSDVAHDSSTQQSVAKARLQAAANAVVLPLQRDLSAHYGSAAVRRGAARPLGPCYRAKARHLLQGSRVHNGRNGHLWKLTVIHRRWCPRCGLWLGPVKGSASQRLSVSSSLLLGITPPPTPAHQGTRQERMVCCRRCAEGALRRVLRREHGSVRQESTGGDESLLKPTVSPPFDGHVDKAPSPSWDGVLQHCKVHRNRRKRARRVSSGPVKKPTQSGQPSVNTALRTRIAKPTALGQVARTVRGNAARTRPPTPAAIATSAAPTPTRSATVPLMRTEKQVSALDKNGVPTVSEAVTKPTATVPDAPKASVKTKTAPTVPAKGSTSLTASPEAQRTSVMSTASRTADAAAAIPPPPPPCPRRPPVKTAPAKTASSKAGGQQKNLDAMKSLGF